MKPEQLKIKVVCHYCGGEKVCSWGSCPTCEGIGYLLTYVKGELVSQEQTKEKEQEVA